MGDEKGAGQDSVLPALDAVLAERRGADPGSSYVASLYGAGLNRILEKVGEEATEVIIAAKDCAGGDDAQKALIGEVADLWFHTLVLLASQGLSSREVLDELARRFGLSGLEEKAARSRTATD